MKLTSPIQKLTAEIKATYATMVEHETNAVNTALYLGALLNELKDAVGHGAFIEQRRELVPGLSDDRAERYMKAAANVIAQVTLPTTSVPVSRLLGAAAADLPQGDREAQQLLFDFTKDKTIKECLGGVIVDGDEPHRITRAANGKKLGGTRGEDRKDWPKFIGEKLSDISSHLKFWPSFTPAQTEDALTKFKSFVGKCPTPLLSHLKAQIDKELKTR